MARWTRGHHHGDNGPLGCCAGGGRRSIPLQNRVPPLLQECDVHYEEQRHEEARNQYERETLHQPRVVNRAEQDCIQEIGNAKQVP